MSHEMKMEKFAGSLYLLGPVCTERAEEAPPAENSNNPSALPHAAQSQQFLSLVAFQTTRT
jgi:hypothetical protein